MSQLFMLCYIEIVKNCSGSNYAVCHALNAESLQRTCLELFQEPVICSFCCKDPVVKLICIELYTEIFNEKFFLFVFIKHFLRLKIIKHLVDVFQSPFCCKKLPCGYVEKCNSGDFSVDMNRSQKIIFVMVQDIVIQ